VRVTLYIWDKDYDFDLLLISAICIVFDTIVETKTTVPARDVRE
jgi:hypothetical protein